MPFGECTAPSPPVHVLNHTDRLLDRSILVAPKHWRVEPACLSTKVRHRGKPKTFDPLTLIGISVVKSYLLQSIAVETFQGSFHPTIHAV